MKISAELSLYPLRETPIPLIEQYIKLLNQQPDIEVRTNSMSTQIFGEYEAVMRAIQICTQEAFSTDSSVSLVCKFLNVDRSISDY
jgi:uncharacterized protein YqgV (UPF0045/DUF77 family)